MTQAIDQRLLEYKKAQEAFETAFNSGKDYQLELKIMNEKKIRLEAAKSQEQKRKVKVKQGTYHIPRNLNYAY